MRPPLPLTPPSPGRMLAGIAAAMIGMSAASMAKDTILEIQPGGGALPLDWSSINNITANDIDRGTYWLVEAGSPGDYIITGDYDLSAYPAIEVNVDVATFDSGTANPLRIEYSTDGGTSWNPNSFTTATPAGSSYIAGGPVTIEAGFTTTTRFRFSAGEASGRGVRIQNLGITESIFEFTTLSPANGAIDISTNTALSITFNASIQAGAGSIRIYDAVPATLVESIAIDASQITGNVLTVTPTAPLTAGTLYYILLDDGAVQDLDGTPFGGITLSTEWTFETAFPDTVGPVPIASIPGNGQSGVSAALDTLSVTFDESITLVGTAPVEVRLVSDDSIVQTIPLDDFISAAVGGPNGDILLLLPFELFEFGTEYYVFVPAGSVEDASSNANLAFGAPASDFPWTFTTFAPASLQDAIPYTQDFATFISSETLPQGWYAEGSVLAYTDVWGAGFSSGFRGAETVLGYQHTGSTGVLVKGLRIKNDTGAILTDLTITYTGRAERLSEGRSPAYVVAVDGIEVSGLAYSTAEGDGVTKAASLSGLNVAPGEIITITWTSDRDEFSSGSSRQIGISGVSIANVATLLPPNLGLTALDLASLSTTGFEASASVTGEGGSPLTERGFVISETTVNAVPEISGTGVSTFADAMAVVGPFTGVFSSLAPSTSYTVRAYATNSIGTNYSNTITVVTAAPLPSLVVQYGQSFNDFTGTLPSGWLAVSSGGSNGYGGAWGSGTSGGFRGGVSNPGVIGYQHTSSTGIVTVSLTLQNDTGGEINQLYVSYLGRVARETQGRSPAWTVKLDGVEVSELFYSTLAAVDELKGHLITGLNIPLGDSFTITWECDRGLPSGGSRQIGIADVLVALDVPEPPPAADFASWIAGYAGVGVLTGPLDDVDGDGIPNILEHVLGFAPDVANHGSAVTTIDSAPGSVGFVHTRIKPADLASDVVQGYEWSTNLVDWTADGGSLGGVTVGFGAPVVIDPSNPVYDVVEVTATVTAGSAERLFVRLAASVAIP